MFFSRNNFLFGYLGQNIYKIYFFQTSIIEHLKDMIFIENDQLIKISFQKDRNLFYYLNFNLKNTLTTNNENILQFIKSQIELFNVKSK